MFPFTEPQQGNQMKLTVKIGNNYGKKVVYHTAAVGIVLDPESNTQ